MTMPESMSIEGPAKAGHYIGPRIAAWVLGGRHHLVFACITRWPGAVQEHATDIAAYVAARFPPPASCDGVQLPW